MKGLPRFSASTSPRSGGAAPASDSAIWHATWAVLITLTAAVMLWIADAHSAPVLLALAVMALPGILGAFWSPKAEARSTLLMLWTAAAILAVCACGGLSGPLAVVCVTPALACLAMNGSWRLGAGLALAAVLISAAADWMQLNPAPPADPVRTWLSVTALLSVAIAAGGSILTDRRRAQALADRSDAELLALRGLTKDAQEFAVLMDGDGRTKALFGAPLDILDADAVNTEVVRTARTADRPKVIAAAAQAFQRGSAEVSYESDLNPHAQISARFRRTASGDLVAFLSPSVTAAAASTLATEAMIRRLDQAEAARRDAEIGRDKAEANAASRALFLANMSHELRTPLNAIMGFSDMMRAKMFGALTPKYAEYAELIHESGGHLLDLINDVLDMSKIEAQRYALAREVFDAREAVDASLRLVRLQADEAGIKLRAVLPDTPLMVDADKRATKQIALNLLTNALKFTPNNGTVIIALHGAGADLEMVVVDTGVGIAADDLKRLGQPFEQAGGSEGRARGTGLGLSLVDAFAKLHGGAMFLESRLGEGTAATVRMPVLVIPVDQGSPLTGGSFHDTPLQGAHESKPSGVVNDDTAMAASPLSTTADPALRSSPPLRSALASETSSSMAQAAHLRPALVTTAVSATSLRSGEALEAGRTIRTSVMSPPSK